MIDHDRMTWKKSLIALHFDVYGKKNYGFGKRAHTHKYTLQKKNEVEQR